MPISTNTNITQGNNQFITNRLATLVALSIAQDASFLKSGSVDYFGDQIKSIMRPGETYEFIIPDAGNVVQGLVASPRDIEEKKIDLSIDNWVNSYNISALQAVVDANKEEDWAKRYAVKVINAVLDKYIPAAVAKSTTAFVGTGFLPLAQGGAYLSSIVSEDLKGWINPQAQAILASNGQQFIPKGGPEDLYGKGKLGLFHGVEYFAERHVKGVNVSAALAGATITAQLASHKVTITSSVEMPEGLPVIVKGLKACDTIGDPTEVDRAFIISKAGTSETFDVIDDDIGARDTFATGESLVCQIPEEGQYFGAYLRADGAYNFSDCNMLDFKLASAFESAVGDVDGIRLQMNAFTDGKTAQNLVRADFTFLGGVVEPRATTYCLLKNLVNNIVNG